MTAKQVPDEDCGAFANGHYCGMSPHEGDQHMCLDCDTRFTAALNSRQVNEA